MTADEGAGEEWRFGVYRLQAIRRLLQRGDTIIPLGSRALGIRILLVERHGRLVTKDEIMDAVRRDVEVEEKNIWEQVKNLRKVLPPDAITTIPGQGYQFTAEMTRPAPIDAPPPAPPPPAPRPASNLPQHLAGLIGRAGELAAVPDSLARHQRITFSVPIGWKLRVERTTEYGISGATEHDHENVM